MSPDLYNLYIAMLWEDGQMLGQKQTDGGMVLKIKAKDGLIFAFALIDNDLWLDPALAALHPAIRLYRILK